MIKNVLLQNPVVWGTGLSVYVLLLAAVFGLVSTAGAQSPQGVDPGAHACNKYNSANVAMYKGYGLPINLFATFYDQQQNAFNEVTIRAMCDIFYDGRQNLPVRFGAAPQNTFTYKYAYRWDTQDTRWVRMNVQADGVKSGDWISGLSEIRIPAQELSYDDDPNYVVGYICTYVNGNNEDERTFEVDGGKWKCGCSNKQCAQGMWQLQEFNVQSAGPAVPAAPGVPR